MTPHSHTLESGYLPLPLAPEPPTFAPTYPGPITYFKRFKMEADLAGAADPDLPAGCDCRAWSDDLLEPHADTLFRSFQGEVDAVVFPSLGDRDGCRSLMSSIVYRTGFLPSATWLLLLDGHPVGTVQGIRERRGVGAIQNLGIVARYRGHGLGGLLLQKAMQGFFQAGLRRVSLEVTAQNERAVQLYRRLGFRRVKTLYKQVPAGTFLPGF